MKMKFLAAVAMAGALAGGGAASAAAFVDYVNVLVPGQTAVTFTAFNDNAPETFIGFTAVPIGFVPGTIILADANGATSDLLTLLLGPNGGVDIFFFSDPSVAPPPDIGPILATLPESGGVQDVSRFFGGNVLVQVGSDINVPEPAAWAMMLVGFGMAGGLMRIRNRSTRAA